MDTCVRYCNPSLNLYTKPKLWHLCKVENFNPSKLKGPAGHPPERKYFVSRCSELNPWSSRYFFGITLVYFLHLQWLGRQFLAEPATCENRAVIRSKINLFLGNQVRSTFILMKCTHFYLIEGQQWANRVSL